MEIEKKLFTRILFIISFITYSSFVLGLPNIEINEEIPNKSFEKPQHKFDPNIKILFNSVAYPANMIDQSFNNFNTWKEAILFEDVRKKIIENGEKIGENFIKLK